MPDDAPATAAPPGFLVIAHRGSPREAPENTLPSFMAALEAGPDYIELDYFHSSDGVPVVFHDDTLDKKTDAVARWGRQGLSISSRSLAELRQLDAGSWFHARFAGTSLATLEESLVLIRNGGGRVMIERKDGDASTVVKLVNRLGMLDRVTVQAFDWDFLGQCHRLEPRLLLGALGKQELTPQRLEAARAAGARVIGWNQEDLTQAGIAAIHQQGLKAWAWTVNDEARAAQLLSWGLDGLITDLAPRMLALRADGTLAR